MSVHLWPKLEVLQLVIPSLGHLNRGLQNSVVIEAIRLTHGQTFITFDRWLMIAKSTLKWNDSCIKLFWDVLCLAVFYVDRKIIGIDDGISSEYIIIFLVLHVIDPHIRPSASSTSQYDTMWPTAMDIDQISPSSPSSNSKRQHLGNSPPSSPTPLSPRSAKNLTSSPKYSKSSSQHLQTLKRKLPLILAALSFDINALEELKNSRDDFVVDLQTLSLGGSNSSHSRYFSGRLLDSLRLIIGGGSSYQSDSLSLSSLHPAFSTGTNLELPILSCSEVLNWFESNLSSNETMYPSGVYNPTSPKQPLSASSASNKTFFPPPTSVDMAIGSIISPQVIDEYGLNTLSSPRYVANQSSTQQPQRIIYPMSSISRSNPTLVHGCNSSTYIHILSDDISVPTSPGIMRVHSASEDDRQELRLDQGEKMQISSGTSDVAMSEGELTDVSDRDLAIRLPSRTFETLSSESALKLSALPSLTITSCVKSVIYALSPYLSGNIASCRDCDVFVGPVSGVVVVIGCEKLRLSVICRKLLIYNCVECEFYVGNLSPTVICGDSRSLSFAPYNVVYRSLKAHLSHSALEGLLISQSYDTSTTTSAAYACDHVVNHWSVLCDLNLCLEASVTAASPTGYAVDALREGVIVLPTPAPSTAVIMNVDKFNFAVIPYRNEYIAPERYLIPLPPPHKDAFQQRKKKALLVQRQLQELIVEGSGSGGIESLEASDEKDQTVLDHMGAITAISPVLTKKFLDWLVRSGRISEVIDLIRIDADMAKSMEMTALSDDRDSK